LRIILSLRWHTHQLIHISEQESSISFKFFVKLSKFIEIQIRTSYQFKPGDRLVLVIYSRNEFIHQIAAAGTIGLVGIGYSLKLQFTFRNFKRGVWMGAKYSKQQQTQEYLDGASMRWRSGSKGCSGIFSSLNPRPKKLAN